MQIKRLSSNNIILSKGKAPLVALTAYTAPFAGILDEYCDILLVGDSLGMVIYGMESTLPVTLDMMINHGRSVVNASKRACVIIDMPFATYQQSPQDAFMNAATIMSETGCQAVKLEGGLEMAETVKFLTQRGIPVMGHVGLQAQSINVYGNYGVRGQSKEEKQKIIDGAKALEDAGAFSIVLENIPKPLADKITKQLRIPTIGIGASDNCDGQILVTEDMLGLFERTPKFVKQYTNLAEVIKSAIISYSNEVRNNTFPTKEHYTK